MKDRKTIILTLVLTAGLLLPMKSSAAENNALNFTKEAYMQMLQINSSKVDFSDEALIRFKEVFDFDEFNNRVMYDLQNKLTKEEYEKLKSVFKEIFFLNFKENTGSLTQKSIKDPTYKLKETNPDFSIISIAGKANQDDLVIDFYIAQKTAGQFFMIDLSIDNILLSRNYRGSFNRIYRQSGFEGLMARLTEKLSVLKEKKA